MEKIDIKYKIQLTGEYNAGVYNCNECYCKLLSDNQHGILYQHIIGFAEGFAIVECPECFEKCISMQEKELIHIL